MNILILGSGGREDAIGHELRITEDTGNIYVAPGNGGTNRFGEQAALKLNDFSSIVDFAKTKEFGLVVVGPEQPLVDGIVDYFYEHAPDILICGPSKAAARLEGSKIFCKTFCMTYGIPTADYKVVRTEADVAAAIDQGFLVVKADGLCGGKGVTVAHTPEEALAAAKHALAGGFGPAGAMLVMERRLKGRECSIMAFCDGERAILMPPARDYKRAFDDDEGPNTGGMGAYSPLPDVDDAMIARIKRDIVGKVIEGMKREGKPYRGILYAGIMITSEDDLYLIEINCRFGDPETQVVLPQLQLSLTDLLIGCSEQGGLVGFPEEISRKGATVCIVMTTQEYPEKSTVQSEILGIKAAEDLEAVKVRHAGTTQVDGRVMVSGGRVLNVVGRGATLHDARLHAYAAVARIHFSGRFRTDIAKDA